MTKLKIFGMILGLIATVLAWIFFGWKLVLVLFLALWGNNAEQKDNK